MLRRKSRPAAAATVFRRPSMVEMLESRTLMHAALANPIPDKPVAPNSAPTTINLADFFTNDDNTDGTKVTFVTSQGDFVVNLSQDPTVQTTVDNFLQYVNNGAYDNTVVHRVTDPATDGITIVQGGGYTMSGLKTATHIPQLAPIALQASDTRPNVRGTIAMARTSDPNSATSEWFINTGDNSTSLGTSNGGGYAVFGTISDMTTPDKIQATPIYNFTGTGFANVPLVNYNPGSSPTTNPNPVLQSNFVTVYDSSVTNGMKFTVSTDRPDLVSPTVIGGRLTLAYAGNAQGTANVTVTAATTEEAQATPATDTFKVTVGTPGSVVLGPNGRKSVTYKDADGTVTTIALKGPGAATVAFAGTGIQSADNKNGTTTVTATGNDLTVDSVTLSSTTTKSSLVFTSKGGNGSADVKDITSATPLRAITAKGVNLTGTTGVTGGVGTIQIRSANGATINSTGGAAAITFTASGAVADTALTATAGIKSLKAGAWTDTDGTTKETITTPSVNAATINGAFAPNLSVAKAINKLTVGGAITGGTISAAGAGTISAASVNGATIRTTGNVSKLTVKGAVTGSTIFAGVKSSLPSTTQTVPAALTDFSTTATIGTLSIGSLGSTNLAARHFSKVQIGSVNTDNAGTAFELVADTYKSLQFSAAGKKFKFANLNDPTKFTPPTTGDFKVVLL